MITWTEKVAKLFNIFAPDKVQPIH